MAANHRLGRFLGVSLALGVMVALAACAATELPAAASAGAAWQGAAARWAPTASADGRPLPMSGVQENAPDWAAIAYRIVEQLQLRDGERFVVVVNRDVHVELVSLLRAAVGRTGAVDLGAVDVMSEPDLSMLESVDASVMLPGAVPGMPVYGAIQGLLREGKGRNIHFHWTSNNSPFPVPGHSVPALDEIVVTYQRAVLDVDYEALAARQRRFEHAIRQAEIRVTSPLGTDLRFEIGDRPVNLQDGDASAQRVGGAVTLIDREIELPAGALRVAPLEQSVNGVVAFPSSQWNGREVEGLKLRFERGRVVEITATRGREAVVAELDSAGVAGRAFREFALGFNPLLAVPKADPWIPYYGYGAGVVRLSLGDNSELGGNVRGGWTRWNFFVDTTVTVGGEVWVRNGELVE